MYLGGNLIKNTASLLLTGYQKIGKLHITREKEVLYEEIIVWHYFDTDHCPGRL